MNRITNLFETKKNGILSVYFTAGYPQLNDTVTILKELEAKGIHMVEVGIPFSDPMADGPVIQEAATQALHNGMSLHLLFDQLKDIRKEVQMPLVLMGYLNPIMQFGFEEFCKKCVETGIDGMIIPDLPFADYMSDYKETGRPLRPETDHADHSGNLRRPYPPDRRTYLRLYLYGIECSHHRSTTEFRRSEAGIFPSYQCNESAESPPGRFRNFQQSNFRSCFFQFFRSHHGSKFIQLLKSEKTISDAVDKLLEGLKK